MSKLIELGVNVAENGVDHKLLLSANATSDPFQILPQ